MISLKSYPLARKLSVLVLFFSILFAAVSFIVQVVINYHEELSALDTRMEKIRVIEVPEISNSIWHFDDDQIEIQLQGMLNLQDVSYVEVVVIGGETFSAGIKPQTENEKIIKFDLTYQQNDETFDIGKLIVIADLSSVRNRVGKWSLSTFLLSVMQTFLLAGILLFLVIRIVTKPLGEIVDYAEKIDFEHLDQPLKLKQRWFSSVNDELEMVVLKLNEMRLRLIDSIQKRLEIEDALRISERNYREIFDATSDGIIIRKVSDGSIVEVNEAVLQMYGYDKKEEMIDLFIQALSADKPEFSNEIAENKIRMAIEQGPQRFEWLAKRKNGEEFWIEVSLRGSSIAGKDRILAAIRDISDRKNAEELLLTQNEALVNQSLALEEAREKTIELNEELENRVHDRTVQLEALNQELEAFSYSVAHDLRAPLRHINGFSQVIIDEYGTKLNDEVIGWLNRIQDSSKNLYNMVEALLGLSRVTRDSIHIMNINVSNMVSRITKQLEQENPDRNVSVIVEEDVYVQADLRLLQVVIENIISNAWKFTAKEEITKIEFSTFVPEKSITQKKCTCFYIRDNGVGFDMGYVDRLFGPFQRLHSSADFSGTGIGLATVKRIVQRHGGRVWAEANVNKGATFYFCFPEVKIPKNDFEGN